ncbi:MAG: hypothetical protein RQ731_10155, partial [Anaerosomatales bacterium]|nr:hypothetical protein [Anaerosomatales bacterium]
VTIVPRGDGPVPIDRIDVVGDMLAPPQPVAWSAHEQDSSHIAYAGAWRRFADVAMSGGSHDWANSSAASATFRTSGTRLRWIATTAPAYGTADLYVDDVLHSTVSLKSASLAYQRVVFDTGTLPAATRTVTIVPRGDGPVPIDRIDVVGDMLAP